MFIFSLRTGTVGCNRADKIYRSESGFFFSKKKNTSGNGKSNLDTICPKTTEFHSYNFLTLTLLCHRKHKCLNQTISRFWSIKMVLKMALFRLGKKSFAAQVVLPNSSRIYVVSTKNSIIQK